MDKPLAWLEVSMICSGELAEAVAEVFSRFSPDGVVINSVTHYDTLGHEEIPTGDMQVVAYFPQDEQSEVIRHQLEESIWHMSQIAPLGPLEYKVVVDQNWMEAWKANYKPLKIGRNLIVLPAWVDPVLAEGRIPIIISPDMAFGTGTHPSTQLCMLALEKYGAKEMDVIDIGTGSGILSIEAAKLGAERILGVDNDPVSIPSAINNANLNGVGDRIIFEVGTHTDVLNREDGLNQAPRVIANILSPILAKMLSTGLADLVSPLGLLFLGGVLEHQAQDLADLARTLGMTLRETLHQEDWVVLVLHKPA
ncbi:MAG TPA: 50S ribosomal protein L11 methyltransferase [Anaerolineaceae bacterium]|nr:50S ribosomal protein L11 methyltransferase [Anaerolineaceae bacterium]